MSATRISFVIPAYNAAATVAESVDSIFNGNFSAGDEVIIVNDASTDQTAAALEALRVRYAPHITVLTNEANKGCPATRNVGIRIAKNKLIFNLDADNILVPGMIEKLVSALTEHEADMAAFAEYRYFTTSPSRITHHWFCRIGWFTLPDLFAGHINPGPGGNFLYTKASWERIGGYAEYGKGLHEAWGFTLKQLAAGSRLYVVPETYYLHRHGHESLFVSESKDKAAEQELLKKFMAPYQNRFTPAEWQYLSKDSSWYYALDKRPLKLEGEPLGSNGTMEVTWYGRYRSLIRALHSHLTS